MTTQRHVTTADAGGLTPASLLLLSLCSFVYLFDGLTSAIIGPLAPGMAQSLQLNRAELGPLFAANAAGSGVGLVVISLLPRYLGERRVLIGSIFTFGLFSILTGLAQSRDALIALRFLTNIGLGGALPICLAMAARAVSPRRHASAVMILITAFGIGAFLSGIIGSWFQAPDAWRRCLYLVGALSIVSGMLCMVWLRPPPVRSGQDTLGTPTPRRSPLALFGRELLLGTMLLWLLFIGVLMTQTIITSWLPVLLVELGRDGEFASLAISAFMAGGVIACPLVGILMDRWGSSRVLIGFLAVSIITIYAMGAGMAKAGETVLLIIVAVAGFFMLGAYGGVNVVVARYYPEDLRTVGIGWAKFAARVGTLAAPIATGFALENGMSQRGVITVAALTMLVPTLAAVLLAWLADRSTRTSHEIPAETAQG